MRERSVRLGSQGRATAHGGREREGGAWACEWRVRPGAAAADRLERKGGVRSVCERGVRCVRERRERAVQRVAQTRRGRKYRDLVTGRGMGARVWKGESCAPGRDTPARLARPPWREGLG